MEFGERTERLHSLLALLPISVGGVGGVVYIIQDSKESSCTDGVFYSWEFISLKRENNNSPKIRIKSKKLDFLTFHERSHISSPHTHAHIRKTHSWVHIQNLTHKHTPQLTTNMRSRALYSLVVHEAFLVSANGEAQLTPWTLFLGKSPHVTSWSGQQAEGKGVTGLNIYRYCVRQPCVLPLDQPECISWWPMLQSPES